MRQFDGRPAGALALVLLLHSGTLPAQDTAWTAITDSGVIRAAAAVDSVFLDHLSSQSEIIGGDWTAYLMARLGVHPIPPSLGFLVMVDSQRIILSGRIRDLPPASRPALGPLLGFLDSETVVRAFIGLHPAGARAVRFRLETVTIAGFPIPEPFLQSAMSDIGRQYPALTASGRDLLIEIPAAGRITLLPAAVRLTAPPDSGPAGKEKGR
jgi:hypothetical protein